MSRSTVPQAPSRHGQLLHTRFGSPLLWVFDMMDGQIIKLAFFEPMPCLPAQDI